MRKGFTLLELIIVIIIVGVLAGVALPRFFRIIEYSRSAEAITSLMTLRGAMERCVLMNNQKYNDCILRTHPPLINTLGIEDPGEAPNAHFVYGTSGVGSNGSYTFYARRNTRDGGDGSSEIFLSQNAAIKKIEICGDGVFIGLGACGSF